MDSDVTADSQPSMSPITRAEDRRSRFVPWTAAIDAPPDQRLRLRLVRIRDAYDEPIEDRIQRRDRNCRLARVLHLDEDVEHLMRVDGRLVQEQANRDRVLGWFDEGTGGWSRKWSGEQQDQV